MRSGEEDAVKKKKKIGGKETKQWCGEMAQF